MAKQKRRRQLLVDRKIQVGLSLRIIVSMAAYMMLFGLVAIMGPLYTIATGMPGDDAVVAAGEKLNGMFTTFLIPGVLTFACLAMHCFVMLHHLAGPAYRFRTVLASIREGDVSGRVKLREGDFLIDVAESMDATVASIRSDFEAMKAEATELANSLEHLAESDGADDPSRASVARDRSRRLLDMIGKYKTSNEKVDAEALPEAEEATGLEEEAPVLQELETPA